MPEYEFVPGHYPEMRIVKVDVEEQESEHFFAPGVPFRSWSYVGDPRPKMH